MNGCEMLNCTFIKDGICTDDEPIYKHICRYNQYWQTEEGRLELEQYEGGIPNE